MYMCPSLENARPVGFLNSPSSQALRGFFLESAHFGILLSIFQPPSITGTADPLRMTEIRRALDKNITAENVLTEVEYLNQPNRKSFERTYGWAWLLKLAEELHDWEDPDGRKWADNLAPLTKAPTTAGERAAIWPLR